MPASSVSSTGGLATFRLARVIWALLFALVLAIMVWRVHATWWQTDDAYISYRYVWHFVHGNGLVFNAGERVEGYTNFAWVLELAAMWKVLGIGPEAGSIVLSLLATIGALVCIVLLARTGPWKERITAIVFGALLLLAGSQTWAVWATSGLETRQFTLLVLLGVLLLHGARARSKQLVLASFAFAIAELTRPEALMMWACVSVWLANELRIERRFAWRPLVAWTLPFAIVVGAQFLWRHAYYGEWLPNTFYAKYVRPWPDAGFSYLATALIETGAWLWIPFAIVGGIARARRGDRLHVLTALLIVPHAAYLVRIGGDVFELRPFDFYWPLLAIATVEGIGVAASFVARGTRRRVAGLVAAGLLLVAFTYGSALQYAVYHVTLSHTTRATALKLTGHVERDDAPWLFVMPGMDVLVAWFNGLRDADAPRCVGTLWRVQDVMWREELEQWGPYTKWSGKQPLPADAVLATISIGVIGWCLPELTIIDRVGLTDHTVARTPVDKPNSARILGHDRAATYEYLRERGVNIGILPAATSRDGALAAAAYALKLDEITWMPFDSPDPAWVARAFRGKEVWTWATERCVGCFGDGVGDWKLDGDAFARNPRKGLPFASVLVWPRRSTGDMGLDTRDESGGGRGRGSARSGTFVAVAGQRLEVRVAGTSRKHCGVRVCAGEDVLAFVASAQPASLLAQQVALTPFAGRTLHLEVFDDGDEDWIVVADAVLLEPRRVE